MTAIAGPRPIPWTDQLRYAAGRLSYRLRERLGLLPPSNLLVHAKREAQG